MRGAVFGIGVFGLAVLGSGCGSALSFIPLGRPIRPGMVPPSQIAVYTAGPPRRPYVEAGLLEVWQQSEFSLDDTEAMLHKLRRFAAHHGCDGVVLIGSNDRTSKGYLGVTTRKGFRATCIQFPDRRPHPPPGLGRPAPGRGRGRRRSADGGGLRFGQR